MRLNYLDSLRGMAVIWMVIFHTAYDLRTFHIVSWSFTEGFWYYFPRLIAFTFLFCVGISLNFSHHPKPNWKSLKKRSFKLSLGALIISLTTYILFPQQWIYFGTLHCILVGSLLGALVVNHRRVAFILLLFILTGQYLLAYDIKWISGLLKKPSMDFIPIYPWFWAILLGILLEPYLSRNRCFKKMAPRPFLNILGQNSLKIYLLHQPIIFGLIWLLSTFVLR